MALCYSLCFVLNWLVGLLGLLALLPVGSWVILDSSLFVLVVFVVVLAAAVFGLWTRVWPNVKHRIRAGVLFSSFCADVFPTTEEELVDKSVELYERGNGSMSVVSHGWSFYLQKEQASGPRVWTTRFKGAIDEEGSPPLTWKSGTALVDVKASFAQYGLTLIDTPSMEWLSLGSWIVSCSHGHPGTKSAYSSPLAWVASARVLDCESRQVTEDDEATLFAKFHSTAKNLNGRYVILTVTFRQEALVENKIVQRFATRLDTPSRVEEWKRGEFMRLSFVSRHRRTLGIVWNTPTNNQVNLSKRYHMHPHTCSRFCFWNHSDVDSTLPCNCGGFAENNQRYDGYAKLADAFTGINPTFWPIQTIVPQMLCIYNTELFVPLPASKLGDTNWLFELIIRLEDFHYKFGGRTELRVSSDSTVLFLDLSIRSLAAMQAYRSALLEHGVKKAAQHPGKWVSREGIGPLQETSVSAVFRSLGAA